MCVWSPVLFPTCFYWRVAMNPSSLGNEATGDLVVFNYTRKLKWHLTHWGGNKGTPFRHFADDIFKCIFLNGNIWIPIKISLKFVPKGPINNIPALAQILAWRRSGDKPLSEPMMVSLLTHICVTRPQWVNHHSEISLDELKTSVND